MTTLKRETYVALAVFAAAVILTALLYKPFGVFAYKIREPYFLSPIKMHESDIVIRNDSAGDGAYGAKRRGGRSHSGVDILAPLNTPVYAAKSGLAFRGYVPTGYGKYVMIYHPDGYQTFYAHLSEWACPPVKEIKRGELIGYVGKTGNASSKRVLPHLHFEIRKDGAPRDPGKLMKRRNM